MRLLVDDEKLVQILKNEPVQLCPSHVDDRGRVKFVYGCAFPTGLAELYNFDEPRWYEKDTAEFGFYVQAVHVNSYNETIEEAIKQALITVYRYPSSLPAKLGWMPDIIALIRSAILRYPTEKEDKWQCFSWDHPNHDCALYVFERIRNGDEIIETILQMNPGAPWADAIAQWRSVRPGINLVKHLQERWT